MARKKERGKSNAKLIVLGILLVAVIVMAVFFLFPGKSEKYTSQDLDNFAKCVTNSGTVMYGAFWCPHCAKTKKTFGESFRYINYVECDPRGDNEQAELCIEKGIEAYDTWEFSDGSRIISEPTFEQLSEKTGCPVPGA